MGVVKHLRSKGVIKTITDKGVVVIYNHNSFRTMGGLIQSGLRDIVGFEEEQ